MGKKPKTIEAPKKIAGYGVHPAAAIFPMMTEAEFAELVADIEKNGQRDAIELYEGKILDGRNRGLACMRLGIKPRFEQFDWRAKGSPTAYVMSKNLKRRHLNESQRGMIAAAAAPFFEAEAKERQRAGAKKGGEGGKGKPKAKAAKAEKVSAPGRGASPKPAAAKPERKAAKEAAASVGVGTRTVERAKAVKKKAPELAEKVMSGELTLKQAEKQIRRTEQIAQVKAYVPPAGEFPVIVVDFPWKYDDQLDGSDQVRGGCPYPPMTIDEICKFDLPLPSNDGAAAVFMWVTNSHLIDPAAYAVVARTWAGRYGLKPKQIRTWKTPEMGLGHVWRNDTEHLIRFERGRPVYNQVTQRTSFEAPPGVSPDGKHSAKPDRAYDDIVELCPAEPKLEMFARKERAGWITTGAELPSSASPASIETSKQEEPDGCTCEMYEPDAEGVTCLCGHAPEEHRDETGACLWPDEKPVDPATEPRPVSEVFDVARAESELAAMAVESAGQPPVELTYVPEVDPGAPVWAPRRHPDGGVRVGMVVAESVRRAFDLAGNDPIFYCGYCQMVASRAGEHRGDSAPDLCPGSLEKVCEEDRLSLKATYDAAETARAERAAKVAKRKPKVPMPYIPDEPDNVPDKSGGWP